MTISAMVVDDERLARSRLRRLLEGQAVAVVAEARDGEEALEVLQRTQVDMVFLDINMPRLNGLQTAERIVELFSAPPALVFCTAYDEYALQAFKTSAAAYLLKPVNAEDLQTAIEKASRMTRMQLQNVTAQVAPSLKLRIKLERGVESVAIGAIAYFRSVDKHVYAFIQERGEVLVDYTLKQLQDQFADEFVRVHRSALANGQKVQRLDKQSDGSYLLYLESAERALPVSRRHLSKVKEWFS